MGRRGRRVITSVFERAVSRERLFLSARLFSVCACRAVPRSAGGPGHHGVRPHLLQGLRGACPRRHTHPRCLVSLFASPPVRRMRNMIAHHSPMTIHEVSIVIDRDACSPSPVVCGLFTDGLHRSSLPAERCVPGMRQTAHRGLHRRRRARHARQAFRRAQ